MLEILIVLSVSKWSLLFFCKLVYCYLVIMKIEMKIRIGYLQIKEFTCLCYLEIMHMLLVYL